MSVFGNTQAPCARTSKSFQIKLYGNPIMLMLNKYLEPIGNWKTNAHLHQKDFNTLFEMLRNYLLCRWDLRQTSDAPSKALAKYVHIFDKMMLNDDKNIFLFAVPAFISRYRLLITPLSLLNVVLREARAKEIVNHHDRPLNEPLTSLSPCFFNDVTRKNSEHLYIMYRVWRRVEEILGHIFRPASLTFYVVRRLSKYTNNELNKLKIRVISETYKGIQQLMDTSEVPESRPGSVTRFILIYLGRIFSPSCHQSPCHNFLNIFHLFELFPTGSPSLRDWADAMRSRHPSFILVFFLVCPRENIYSCLFDSPAYDPISYCCPS